MKRKYVTISWALALLFLLGPVRTLAASLSDVKDHWAETQIKWSAEKGWIKGYPDGTFKPNGLMTNAEFVSLINRVAELKGEKKVNYTDIVIDEWYFKDIEIGVANNYLYNTGKFYPNESITREEVARIIGKIYSKKADLNELKKFSDYKLIKDDAKEAVAALTKIGIINGYPEGDFKPQNNITRAEVAIILYKMFNENLSEFKNSEISKAIESKVIAQNNRTNDYIFSPELDYHFPIIIPGPQPQPKPDGNINPPVKPVEPEKPVVPDTPDPDTSSPEQPKDKAKINKVYWKALNSDSALFKGKGKFLLKIEDIIGVKDAQYYKITFEDAAETPVGEYIVGFGDYKESVKVFLYDNNRKLIKTFESVNVEKEPVTPPNSENNSEKNIEVFYKKGKLVGGEYWIKVNEKISYTDYQIYYIDSKNTEISWPKVKKDTNVKTNRFKEKVNVRLFNNDTLVKTYTDIAVK